MRLGTVTTLKFIDTVVLNMFWNDTWFVYNDSNDRNYINNEALELLWKGETVLVSS
jgi:hypothetical protein